MFNLDQAGSAEPIETSTTVDPTPDSAVAAPDPAVAATPEPAAKADTSPKGIDRIREMASKRLAELEKSEPTTPPAAAPRGDDGKFKSPTGKAVPPATPPGTPAPKPDIVPVEKPDKTAAQAEPFNFKFKVREKEHEIPEYLRGSVKTPEQAAELKEVFEKAYGLDIVKDRHVQLRTQHQSVLGEVGEFKKNLGEMRKHYERNDLESVFKMLNLPEEKVLQYVLDKLEYQELPKEQQNALARSKQAERDAFVAQNRAEQLETHFQERAYSEKVARLDSTLARADVSAVAQAYETRIGKPGAFRDMVSDYGEMVWTRTQGKTDLSPEQAVEAVLQMLGHNPAPASSAPAAKSAPGTPAQPAAASTTAPQPHTVPVIPNVGGAPAASPTSAEPKFRSIKEIEAYRKKTYG